MLSAVLIEDNLIQGNSLRRGQLSFCPAATPVFSVRAVNFVYHFLTLLF